MDLGELIYQLGRGCRSIKLSMCSSLDLIQLLNLVHLIVNSLKIK